MIKGFFKFIGIGVLFLTILIVIAVIWGSSKQSSVEKLTLPYIENNLNTLLSWETSEIAVLMDKSVADEIDPEQFKDTINYLSKLGEFRASESPQFINITSGATTELGAHSLITYQIPSIFENGTGVVTLSLIVREEAITVHTLRINSDVFLN